MVGRPEALVLAAVWKLKARTTLGRSSRRSRPRMGVRPSSLIEVGFGSPSTARSRPDAEGVVTLSLVARRGERALAASGFARHCVEVSSTLRRGFPGAVGVPGVRKGKLRRGGLRPILGEGFETRRPWPLQAANPSTLPRQVKALAFQNVQRYVGLSGPWQTQSGSRDAIVAPD